MPPHIVDVWTSPIAIGGVGGSGTRVLAGMLQHVGFYLGDDLNEALDNLWYTLLFKDRRILTIDDHGFSIRLDVFCTAMIGGAPLGDNGLPLDLVDGDRPGTGRVQHSRDWLEERLRTLTAALRRNGRKDEKAPGPWAWKEPNSHVVLDRLNNAIPGLRYIHVVRNGLDMAFSGNQNQLGFWGQHFLAAELGRDPTICPEDSLGYWCHMERRTRAIGQRMGSRFHLIRFEDLCHEPRREVGRLLGFLGVLPHESLVSSLASMVEPPASLGRARGHDLRNFNPKDMEFLRSCGY